MTTGHFRPNRNLPPNLLANLLRLGAASSRKPSAASAKRRRFEKTSPGAKYSSGRVLFHRLRTRPRAGIRAGIRAANNGHYPAGLEALAAIK
jgi:hypothetical protein